MLDDPLILAFFILLICWFADYDDPETEEGNPNHDD